MLSTTSEYALRALACLAGQPQGTDQLGRDLAKAAEIPANYLSKILLALRNAELVDTTRGSGGGYRLHKPAEEIFLIDVVELFDGMSRNKPACFLQHQKPCSSSSSCSAHVLWADLQARYLGFLVSTPLSALAPQSLSVAGTSPNAVNLPAAGGQR
ncbi:MAG TPA: Rrf2 family transcriptional regulator [Terriglobales bacterium]|jgi:Rrf2 family transcriptional regulator, iron-sulfur cluster assembly transcription factor